MRLTRNAEMAVLAAVATLMFMIGVSAVACVSAPQKHAAPVVSMPDSSGAEIVIGYALAHPDPAVSGSFADKLKRGEIKIVLEKPKEHAMASFGERGGGYVLTIDPERLKLEPTKAELEDALSIISHEHAHYRQFVEGEMANYYPRDGKMTEAQCTLTILVEIDAHGKACRDALVYGWSSQVAASACERTTASLAEYFLRERAAAHPACKPVWEFYATHVPGKKPPAAKTRAANPPRKRSGPIYLPPP